MQWIRAANLWEDRDGERMKGPGFRRISKTGNVHANALNDATIVRTVSVEGKDIARTARIVLSGRAMGRIYHAKGVERLVRNELWKGRTAEGFYDALQWLYGWNVSNCLVK